MANNPIYIKRSTGNGSPSSLANGELAYSNTSQVLFIGMGGSVYRIAGLQVPGTLTANQALVANATSGINNIITANLSISGYLTANGSLGGTNQYLTSNATGGVYWSSPGAASVNTQAQYVWTNTHTFQANVSITGNATAELLIASLGAAAALGGSTANQTGFYLGNSTVNTSWTYTNLTVGSSVVGNASITEGTLGAAAAVGGVSINTTAVALGNSTINATWTYTSLTIGSSVVGNASITVGTLGAAAAVGGIQVNTTVIGIGNSTVNTSINATSFSGQSATVANGGVSVGNNQLVSNTTGLWIDQTKIDHNSLSNYVGNQHIDHTTVSISAGNGLTGGGTIASTRTLSVLANSGLIANATGTFVNPNNGISANSTGVFAVGANGITITSAGINVLAGDNTLVANSTGAFVNSNLSLTNLTLSGNLTVSGTTTTLNTTTLNVQDNMILLGDNIANTGTFTDNIDTGVYTATGNTSVTYYSGLVRVAASSTNTTPFFKLFSTTTAPNSTVVNTSATLGTLNAYLSSAGLISNSTVVNITANSTLSVALVANSLSLTTQLAVGYGGTGQTTLANNGVLIGNAAGAITTLALGTSGYVLQSNGTTVVYDVIDGGLF